MAERKKKDSISGTIRFNIGDMFFEYDEAKEEANILKHGISLRSAARVFFDYDRIELYDENHSETEERYNTIGDTSAGNLVVGRAGTTDAVIDDILFVVYTERFSDGKNAGNTDVTRLISARQATNFERGIYYGKFN